MKIELIRDTMIAGVAEPAGRVLDLDNSLARMLKGYGKAKDYVDPDMVMAEDIPAAVMMSDSAAPLVEIAKRGRRK